MSESELNTSYQSYSATDRPGQRLAEARKARGLSLEEMAAQLRLNVSTLQALEADDYSRLPPAAYVSGYLRSYARALGLADAEANRGGTATPVSEPPLVGVVARSHTAQVQANDPRVRIVTYLILGGLLLVSSGWWLMQREETSRAETSAPVVTVPDTSGVASAEPASSVPVVTPAPETATVPTAVAPNIVSPAQPITPAPVQMKPAVAQPVPAPAIKPVVPVVSSPATAIPAAPTVANAATPATANTPVADAQQKPATPPPPPLTSATPQSKIVLEFNAECWVDVMDAAGRQVAYELALPDRKMTLRGEAPFKVFFGYSPGVQVTFNDQPFDHKPYQRRDVARFKLGTAEDNALLTEAQ